MKVDIGLKMLLKSNIKLKFYNLKKNNSIIEWLKSNNISYISNFDIKKKSWLKAGGTAELVIYPNKIDDAIKTVKYFIDENINFYPIGNFSNTIFRDGLIETPLINLKNINDPILELKNENKENLYFKVSSGLSLFKYVNFIQNLYKITGQEGLIGIPGTVGGAIYTNASSYGSCISDFLIKIEFIDKDGNLVILNKNEILFGWRKSIFHGMEKFLILNVYFSFPKKNVESEKQINNKISNIKSHRKKYQENKLPNLGSLYATKNLYKDLSKITLPLFLLYGLYILGTKITYIFFNEDKLLKLRRFICKLYCIYFKINDLNFSLSEKTINCLVNKGSDSSSKAFELVEKLELKIKKKINLENIILKNIK